MSDASLTPRASSPDGSSENPSMLPLSWVHPWDSCRQWHRTRYQAALAASGEGRLYAGSPISKCPGGKGTEDCPDNTSLLESKSSPWYRPNRSNRVATLRRGGDLPSCGDRPLAIRVPLPCNPSWAALYVPQTRAVAGSPSLLTSRSSLLPPATSSCSCHPRDGSGERSTGDRRTPRWWRLPRRT